MPKPLTRERLKELLTYNPDTGEFWWLCRKGRSGAGTIAGSKDTKYCHIRVDGGRYYAHRLAFLYMAGNWPTAIVDHRNLDKRDNRWSNLRLANHSQNAANSITTVCTAGMKGVRKTKYGRFQARIKIKGVTCHIGTYATADMAAAAYLRAAAAAFGNFSRATSFTANKD